MILSPRTLARSAFLCAIAVTAAHLFRFGSAVVPFSLLPGVYVLGAIAFSPRENSMGWIIYLLLGLSGVPVFASPPYGGLGYIFKPSFGFLLGYLFMSPLIAWIAHRRKTPTHHSLLFLSLMAVGLLYGPGLVYFWLIMKFVIQAEVSTGFILKTGFFPFIGGDLLKAVVASLIVWRAKLLRREGE